MQYKKFRKILEILKTVLCNMLKTKICYDSNNSNNTTFWIETNIENEREKTVAATC